jgi:glycosyltransferase involved in cell wall biosynthesis
LNSSLGVIIPAFNEEEGIAPTIKELKLAIDDARIIVVDGNSKDKTPEIAKDLGVEVIYQNAEGKGEAILQGLANLDGDIVYARAHHTIIRIVKFRYKNKN